MDIGPMENAAANSSNGFQLDADLRRRIEEIADARGTTPADVIRTAIDKSASQNPLSSCPGAPPANDGVGELDEGQVVLSMDLVANL